MSLRLHLKRPRLLPLTCSAMAGLLLLKSAALVQAAAMGADPAPEHAGEARAAAPPPASSPPDVKARRAAASSATLETAVPAAPPAAVSDEERALLLDLRHRREQLEAKSKLLDQREAEMQAADRKLDARVEQLTALQTRLEALEATRQEHQSENWAGLVKTYEAMKPRDAAAIFDALDMQVLLQVLDRMQERRAAAVLAAMQPDRARLATQLLAEMRVRASAPPSPAPLLPETAATKPDPKT
jgi:flagellar motility protein MotE (MotC chaperone)